MTDSAKRSADHATTNTFRSGLHALLETAGDRASATQHSADIHDLLNTHLREYEDCTPLKGKLICLSRIPSTTHTADPTG